MKIILILLSLFAHETYAQIDAKKEANVDFLKSVQSLTYFRNGRDADGILSLDRLEIRTSGIVNWDTNSRGFFCPLESGSYKGKVSKDDLSKLTALAVEVQKEQSEIGSKISDDNESSRDVVTSLFVRRDGNYLSSTMFKLTDKVKAFEKELWKIKNSLKPDAVLSMEVKEKKSYLEVKFSLQGKGPFKLVLPEKAEEAFFTPKGKSLAYHTKPKKLVILLNAKNKHFHVKLKPFPGKDEVSKEVLFQNGAVIHHGGRRTGDPIRAQEVNMCGVIK